MPSKVRRPCSLQSAAAPTPHGATVVPLERIPIEWIGIRSAPLALAHVPRFRGGKSYRKTGIHFSGTCARVADRACEARDQAKPERLVADREHDRDRCHGGFGVDPARALARRHRGW